MMILLIVYFTLLFVVSIFLSISEPLTAEDSGLVSMVRGAGEGYREISEDFSSLIAFIRVPLVIFIMINIFIIYVMCWVIQGKFLLGKGWK